MNVPVLPAKLNLSTSPAAVADAAELAELFNAIADADATPERLSETSMQHELESYFDPLDGRTAVARDDAGTIVGYATVYSRRAEADEMRAYVNVYVDPAWRGRGLEDSMIDWGIEVGTSVLREVAAERRFVCGWLYKKQEQMSARFAARDPYDVVVTCCFLFGPVAAVIEAEDEAEAISLANHTTFGLNRIQQLKASRIELVFPFLPFQLFLYSLFHHNFVHK